MSESDEVLSGEIMPPAKLAVARTNPVNTCLHQWRLFLVPGQPTEVYCSQCPAGIDDIWDDASAFLHIKLPGFSVDGRVHTAPAVVDWRVDLYIRESSSLSMRTMSFEREFEIQVRPHAGQWPTLQIEGPASGTGWCAPST